eukprot:TRINITY_DN81726_c0_g1_i1.p1 TRINITY_DN81726_c0_g1~~TRINITY_DN81726_c0_g1_i1.p1  ORF type:complete len:180 (+),score=43.24 TRINITY_DN81726_c0_g1_i1:917-1456(+)
MDEFLENRETLRSVLRVAAEKLRISPQDVRFHRIDPSKSGLSVLYYLEVENPFLRRDEVLEWFIIDQWFAALPVPIDGFTVLSQDQLYAPPPIPPPEPQIKPWMWAAAGAATASIILVYPLYACFFSRKYNEVAHTKIKTVAQDDFLEKVVNSAPDAVISALAAAANNTRVVGNSNTFQ